jgi:endonuclease/exonuclease/phosphatase family metal-dependent hydrolase
VAGLLVLGACAPATIYESGTGPRYAGAASPAADPVPGLRVATFNIRYAKDVEGALDALRADEHLRGADALALQEMDAPGVEAIARALGMSYVYYPAATHPRGGQDFGNAVLVRGRIVEDGKVFLPHLSRGRAMQRVAAWADVDVDGRTFRMYSLHLSADAEMSRRKRLDQVRALLAHAREHDGPVVMAGDFNDRGAVGYAFQNAGYEWVSRDLPATVSWFTWDHIVARGLRLAALDRRGVGDPRGSSDHRPVWADLEPVPSSTARRTTR